MPGVSTLPIDLTDPEHPKAGKPEPFLAAAAFAQVDPVFSPDGKRVVMFPRPVAEESTGNLHATFLLNFFDEVRRRVPLGK